MDARVTAAVAGIGLLAFLFFPRSDPEPPAVSERWAATAKTVEGEPLRFPGTHRPNPPLATLDLGFIYMLDKAELIFADPGERGPRVYEIAVSPSREGPYQRVFSYRSARGAIRMRSSSFRAGARGVGRRRR